MTPRHRLPEKNYKVVKTAAGQFSQIDPVFSSDSRYIFAATGSTVKVLKITTCAVVRSLEHPHPVKAFMLNPKNKLQLMVACDKTVYVWDWQDGVLLKTVKMDHPITHMFSALKSTESVYYVVLDPENNNGRSFYKCDLDFDESNTRHLFDTPYFESFTYASNGSFFATAHEYDITVTFENGTSETYTTPGKKATSLHINVRDDVVAAGCNNGEIRLIPCANGKLDMAAVASNHWHKNPVPAVRFLGDGVTLLSGGEETVLVFWNTLFQRRHFVPRVGGPIKSIVASPNHALYALLLGNNLIQLINSTTRDIQYSIQGLQTPAVHTPTCLMAREPRNKHLAFSSSPGTIQFYDYALDKHNSTLEVAPQNYNVHHIAFSRDGRWMATVDTLEKETSGSLKFWEWNEDEQFYKLHTSILNFEVSKKGTLLFNNARGNDGLMALTTSGGKTFKVWMLEQAAEKGVVWKCRSENSFRNYSPNAAAFSADDSIIVVGFDRLITLWDTFENKVMDALVQPSGYQVQELHFLGDSPFMLSVTKHEFAVWNILTMDVWYSYNVPCQFVAVDRHSNRFAVIARLFNTSAKQLLVFSPDSSIPESCTPLTNSILGMEFDKEIVLVTNDYSILQLSATTPETAKEERAEIEDVPETGIFDSVFGRRQQEAREAAEQASLTEKIRQGEANVQEALALLAGPSQSLPGVSDVFESIMTSLMELRVVDKTVEEGQQVDVAMEEQEEMDQDTTLDITLQSNFKLDKFSDLKFPSLVDKASISKAKAEESSSSSEESEEEEDPSDIAW